MYYDTSPKMLTIPPNATVKQLKLIAEELGMKGYSTLRKDELLKRIQSHQRQVSKRRSQSGGVVMVVTFPGKDITLFKIKDPGDSFYTELYSQGQKSIAFTRSYYKEKFPDYKWLERTATVALSNQLFPSPHPRPTWPGIRRRS